MHAAMRSPWDYEGQGHTMRTVVGIWVDTVLARILLSPLSTQIQGICRISTLGFVIMARLARVDSFYLGTWNLGARPYFLPHFLQPILGVCIFETKDERTKKPQSLNVLVRHACAFKRDSTS